VRPWRLPLEQPLVPVRVDRKGRVERNPGLQVVVCRVLLSQLFSHGIAMRGYRSRRMRGDSLWQHLDAVNVEQIRDVHPDRYALRR
jgi:hypothetical protein